MKILLLFWVILSCSTLSLAGDNPLDEMGYGELLIKNVTGNNGGTFVPIKIEMYPASAIFNGQKKYSPVADPDHLTPGYPRITGGEREFWSNEELILLNNDMSTSTGCKFNFGFGLYLIKFYFYDWQISEWEEFDYCYVDWRDALYPYDGWGNPPSPYPRNLFTNDIKIYVYSLTDIQFYFYGGTCTSAWFPISEVNRHIKIYEQYKLKDGICQWITVTPETGIFTTDPTYLTNWPWSAFDYPNPGDGTFHLNPEKFSNGLDVTGRNVTFKNNEKLEFGDEAKFIADNSVFTTSSGTWEGIKLENSKASVIQDCIFSNVKNPVAIFNSNHSSASEKHVITGNTFNMDASGSKAIELNNVFECLVRDNELNISHSNSAHGLYLMNTLGISGVQQPADMSLSYDLKFINNTFNRFKNAATFINTSAGIPGVYFENNKLTGSDNISSTGILGSKITGRFNNNSYLNNKFSTGVFLSKSTPDFYSNSIKSSNTALALYGTSIPRLEPINSGGNFVWYGGKNTLYTTGGNTVVSNYVNHPMIDYGYNVFNKVNGTNHFLGQLREEDDILYGRRNCWLPNNLPISDLYRIVNGNTVPVSIHYTPMSNCVFELDLTGVEIPYLGDGVYDTVYVTTASSGGIEVLPEDDEIFVNQGEEQYQEGNYYNASVHFRTIMDNFPESRYLYSSLYKIFDCYESMDTTSNPGISYGLWSELYDYLNGKIGQYDTINNQDFIDIAYNLSIMCNVNMGDYEDAMLEYQGIILNHPDPVERLLASWDYDAVFYLLDSLDGEGGSISQLPNHQLRQFGDNGAFSAINFDDLEPVKKIIREGYRKRKIEDNKKAEEKMNTMLRDERNNSKLIAEEVRKDGIKLQIESRARMNIMQLRHLSREEKAKRMMEDMNLIMQLTAGDESENMINNSVPQNYDLRQNYPNPFNPKTIITFSIPSASLVKLNVYDITGRLMKVLTNEIREAGTHNVTFDGTGLSSGVYFYRLEAGNFVDTKRMVFVK